MPHVTNEIMEDLIKKSGEEIINNINKKCDNYFDSNTEKVCFGLNLSVLLLVNTLGCSSNIADDPLEFFDDFVERINKNIALVRSQLEKEIKNNNEDK